MNTQQRIECIIEFLDYLEEHTEIELTEYRCGDDYDFNSYHSPVNKDYVLGEYKFYLEL